MSDETVNPTKEGGDNDMKELAVLTSTPEEIEIGGKKVFVGTLKMGQLVEFTKAIKEIMPTITKIITDKKFDLVGVLGDVGPQLMQACAIGCKQPLEWIEELDPDEFLKLASKIIVVNVDFFARRLPMASALMEKSLTVVTRAQKPAGATPSNS